MRKIAIGLLVSMVPMAASAADLPSRTAAPKAPVFTSFDAFASVSAGYGWSSGKADVSGLGDFNLNGVPFEARASFYAPISNQFGFQADGEFRRDSISAEISTLSTDVIRQTGALTSHIFLRNSTGLIGVIAQGESTSDNFIGLGGQNRRYFLGGEGQYYMGNTTIYGQLAYQNLSFADVGSLGGSLEGSLPVSKLAFVGMNAGLQLRHFVTPNWMAGLNADYQQLSSDGLPVTVKQDGWRIGARTEYRLAATPMSVFGDLGYRQVKFSALDISYKENETRAMVGFKLNFGTQTLFERDRSGASLDPIRPVKMNMPLLGLGVLQQNN